MIHLAPSSEGEEAFQMHYDFKEVFEYVRKDETCLETLIGENVFVACMESQNIPK